MLALDVHLLDGCYNAAGNDRETAEWPPHPARAFCALVAGARDEQDWSALRWLEQQAPPDVIASAQATTLRRSGYVVTNRRENHGKIQTHPGRTNLLRSRVAAQPASDWIRLEWPDVDPPADVVNTLDRLALRVPYLGRSTSPVLASISTGSIEADEARVRFQPCELTVAQSTLRVPYPGYTDDLRSAYDEGRAAWDVFRLLGYRAEVVGEPEPVAAAPSPFTELVVVRTPGVSPDGRLASRFTNALRTALMARVPDPLPAALHGHDLDDQTHVAFLALPNAVNHSARGHLLGLAVALPPLSPEDRRSILRALIPGGDHRWTLDVPGVGEFAVQFDSDTRQPRGATPQRWTMPARSWVSVTPVALDRYPKKGDNLSDMIARSCRLAGYPEPSAVETSASPLAPGAIAFTKNDLPERLRSRVLRHVRLHFDAPVNGPLLIGAGRYLGVGLFAQDSTFDQGSAQ